MKYSFETTVLLWQDDPELFENVKKVCKSLKLNIFNASVQEDILGVPYFFAILDGMRIKPELLKFLVDLLKGTKEKEFALLFTSPPSAKIPDALKKYVIKTPEIINFDFLKKNLYNKHFAILRHKGNKRAYDKTLFRLLKISFLLRDKSKFINIRELSNDFNVTERTIKRDLALLGDMGEDIRYDKDRNGHYLEFSHMDLQFQRYDQE